MRCATNVKPCGVGFTVDQLQRKEQQRFTDVRKSEHAAAAVRFCACVLRGQLVYLSAISTSGDLTLH